MQIPQNDEPFKASRPFFALENTMVVLMRDEKRVVQIENLMKILVIIYNRKYATNYTQFDLTLVLISLCEKHLGINNQYYYFLAQQHDDIDELEKFL